MSKHYHIVKGKVLFVLRKKSAVSKHFWWEKIHMFRENAVLFPNTLELLTK